ncbi:MAG: SsrA-binding protein SmpB [Microgenomates group bacterium]
MVILSNKRARHEYDIGDTQIAGIELTGAEVKSLRLKHGSLMGSYVKPLQGELFLINAQINLYKFATDPNYEPKRTRKLLMRRKEIDKLLATIEQKNVVLVPMSLVIIHNRIKLKIGVGKPLKKFQKREVLKRRDQQRDVERQMKQRY